ncbi:hypothetical protein IHE33_15065 (plasmid) [Mycetohabitans endofungorum]|uniref:JmjC domain-containing protein n=1 Tax=Mycetohabitans endofungorum TaxID=417203 RepID=UPI0030CEC16F
MKKNILTFDSLINPFSTADFFSRYWGREVLVVHRSDASAFSFLPDIADFEALIAGLPMPADGWFSIVKGRASKPPCGVIGADGCLDLSAVYGAVEAGFSLLLTKLHRRDKAIGEMCRNLEIDFIRRGLSLRRPIGANGYYTPPNAQGFNIHFDPHDVLVLQLCGCKHWRIYRRYLDHPLEPPDEPISSSDAGSVMKEFMLKPGEVAYIPRGMLHDALTAETLSLHLTLSLTPLTWRDVFINTMVNEPKFNAAVRSFSDECVKQGVDLMRAFVEERAISTAIGRASHRILEESALLPHGGLKQLVASRTLKPGSYLTLADGVWGCIELAEQSVILHLPGASFRVHHAGESMLRRILESRPFRPGDLPAPIEAEEKLAFVMQLLRAGFLKVVSK